MGSTIFIAGVYGTGKSTLCSALSTKLHIPAFSAGDLISATNGEQYGANKAVVDKENNQILLAKQVRELNKENDRIILAGHFCIFDKNNQTEILPESIYPNLNISQIILLQSNVDTIISHLQTRDGKVYSEENISDLIQKEREQSEKISSELNCPLSMYNMTFTENDLHYIASLLD